MAGAAAALHNPTVRAAGDQIGTLKPGVAVLAIDAAILTMVGSSVRGNLQVLVGIPVTVLGCAVAWTAAAGRPPLLRPLSVTYSLLAIAAAIGVVVPLPHGAL